MIRFCLGGEKMMNPRSKITQKDEPVLCPEKISSKTWAGLDPSTQRLIGKRKAKMDNTAGYGLPVFVTRPTFVRASRISKVTRGPVSYILGLQARPGAVYAYTFEQVKDKPEPREGMYYVARGPYDFTFMTAEEFEKSYRPEFCEATGRYEDDGKTGPEMVCTRTATKIATSKNGKRYPLCNFHARSCGVKSDPRFKSVEASSRF
jgi:hypothetical protein